MPLQALHDPDRAAEAQLRQSDVRFAALVASFKDYAIFLVSADGVVLTWNDGARRIKGYPDSTLAPRTCP
jgi:PAS domain-containing protein